MSLKRQMSWKNILSRRKKTSTSDDDIEENEDGYMDGDNISIGSTTSAFPSFEAKHFSKWKNKWRSGKKGEKGDGDDLSISSTTSAFTSSKFPTPSWTTKFYANKFLKKRGQSKTRGNSECSNGEEELPPWPKSATLKPTKIISNSTTINEGNNTKRMIQLGHHIYERIPGKSAYRQISSQSNDSSHTTITEFMSTTRTPLQELGTNETLSTTIQPILDKDSGKDVSIMALANALDEENELEDVRPQVMVTVDECHSMSGKVTTCLIALDKRFSTKGLQTKKKQDAICSTLGKIRKCIKGIPRDCSEELKNKFVRLQGELGNVLMRDMESCNASSKQGVNWMVFFASLGRFWTLRYFLNIKV